MLKHWWPNYYQYIFPHRLGRYIVSFYSVFFILFNLECGSTEAFLVVIKRKSNSDWKYIVIEMKSIEAGLRQRGLFYSLVMSLGTWCHSVSPFCLWWCPLHPYVGSLHGSSRSPTSEDFHSSLFITSRKAELSVPRIPRKSHVAKSDLGQTSILFPRGCSILIGLA